MALELRQLRYFVAVAHERHFGRAADLLNIAQPTLSAQVAGLERQLGARLLDRTHRQVVLTEAGALFLAEAESTLRQAERAERVGRQAGRGETGAVALGYVGSAPFSPVLATLLHRIRGESPGLELRLSQVASTAQLRGIAEGSLDLGLLRLPVAELPEPLALLALVEEELVVALPQGHRRASAERVALASLADDPFVTYSPQGRTGLHHFVLQCCLTAGFDPVVAQTVPQVATIVCLVAARLGVALVPESVSRLRLPEVVFRPLEAAPRITLVLAHRRDERSPVVRAVTRAARALVEQR